MMSSFNSQLESVKEMNKIKYENKIMKEEDLYSKKCNDDFLKKCEYEKEMYQRQRELEMFISEYILNKIMKGFI